MAIDELEICNNALAEVGIGEITDFTSTNPGKVAGLFYPRARDVLSRKLRLKSTIKRVVLSASTPATLTVGDGNIFNLPDDCLKVLELVTDDDTVEWHIEQRSLITTATTAEIIYITRIVDVTKFDTLFTEALTMYLASKFAMTLKRDAALSKSKMEEYLYIEKEAAINTYKESKRNNTDQDVLIDARHGKRS